MGETDEPDCTPGDAWRAGACNWGNPASAIVVTVAGADLREGPSFPRTMEVEIERPRLAPLERTRADNDW